MYSLYPTGVSDVGWVRGMALVAGDLLQAGCRDRLSMSFTAPWGVPWAASFPLSPSFLFRSWLPLALHLADHKCVGIFTFPIWNRLGVLLLLF